MAETTVNVPLLRKVLEHVTAHPEEYSQSVYATACGTKYCIAGWALTLTGHRFQGEYIVSDANVSLGDAATFEAARSELGLAIEQASDLFQWDNSLDDVWRMAEEFSNGEIHCPSSPETGQ